MSKPTNKIDATNRTVLEVLDKKLSIHNLKVSLRRYEQTLINVNATFKPNRRRKSLKRQASLKKHKPTAKNDNASPATTVLR